MNTPPVFRLRYPGTKTQVHFGKSDSSKSIQNATPNLSLTSTPSPNLPLNIKRKIDLNTQSLQCTPEMRLALKKRERRKKCKIFSNNITWQRSKAAGIEECYSDEEAPSKGFNHIKCSRKRLFEDVSDEDDVRPKLKGLESRQSVDNISKPTEPPVEGIPTKEVSKKASIHCHIFDVESDEDMSKESERRELVGHSCKGAEIQECGSDEEIPTKSGPKETQVLEDIPKVAIISDCDSDDEVPTKRKLSDITRMEEQASEKKAIYMSDGRYSHSRHSKHGDLSEKLKKLVRFNQFRNRVWKNTGGMVEISVRSVEDNAACFRVLRLWKEFKRVFLHCEPANLNRDLCDFYHVGSLEMDGTLIVVLDTEFCPRKLRAGKIFRVVPPWNILTGNSIPHMISSQNVQLVRSLENQEEPESEIKKRQHVRCDICRRKPPAEFFDITTIALETTFDINFEVVRENDLFDFDDTIRNVGSKRLLHPLGFCNFLLTIRKIAQNTDEFKILAADANGAVCYVYIATEQLTNDFAPAPLEINKKYKFGGLYPFGAALRREKIPLKIIVEFNEDIPDHQKRVEQFLVCRKYGSVKISD